MCIYIYIYQQHFTYIKQKRINKFNPGYDVELFLMLVDSGSNRSQAFHMILVDPRIILGFRCLLVRLYKLFFDDMLNCVCIYNGVCQAVIGAGFFGTLCQVVHWNNHLKTCVCYWKWFALTDVCNWCSCFALHDFWPPWNHDLCLTCFKLRTKYSKWTREK